ncbi:MAG: MlaD family protein [Planctomycetota bacterium]|nr:MlaD family protein [Planctomycetota bacterium]
MNTERQLLLGIFFVAALSVLAFYTLFLTDFTLLGERIQLVTDFPHAHGLREGDPVLVAGKRVGRVSKVAYDPAAPELRRIRVTMNLDVEVAVLTGYRIAIQESTFLGGHQVDIYPGPAGSSALILVANEAYAGVVEDSPISALRDVGAVFTENAERFSSLITNLDGLVRDVREGDGMLSTLIYDTELAAKVKAGVADVQAAAAEFGAAADDFASTFEDTRIVAERLMAGEGTLGKLLTDEKLYGDLSAAVETIRAVAADLEAGQGTLGLLLRDEEMRQQVVDVVTRLEGFTRQIEESEGLLGLLMNDPQPAEDVRVILANIRTASEDIVAVAKAARSSEGSLGALLNERELYDEVLTVVKLLTRSLEDYREAAPVTAFTGVLFGAL